MKTKKRIRRVFDHQKSIEELANPFNNDIFYELIELLYWVKFLEKEGTLSKTEMDVLTNWEESQDDKAKNKIVNEVYTILEIMNYEKDEETQ